GELASHGAAPRPASATGLGFLGGRPVFLPPGNPVSCLCAYDLFASRAVRGLGGRPRELPYPARRLPLARKIVSVVGRVDYVRVQVSGGRGGALAGRGGPVLRPSTPGRRVGPVPAGPHGHAP